MPVSVDVVPVPIKWTIFLVGSCGKAGYCIDLSSHAIHIIMNRGIGESGNQES
jgi:hypothetical protein